MHFLNFFVIKIAIVKKMITSHLLEEKIRKKRTKLRKEIFPTRLPWRYWIPHKAQMKTKQAYHLHLWLII